MRWASIPGRRDVVAYARTLDDASLPLPEPVETVSEESGFVLLGVVSGFLRVFLTLQP